jgi:hypothetical protein
MSDNISTYPIAIIEDRYTGVYSKGAWLAIAKADEPMPSGSSSRLSFCLAEEPRTPGPHGDDTEAMAFWNNPPDWIAVGSTPDKALEALRGKVGRF